MDTSDSQIEFDENGICSGCKIHDEKNQLNWKERYEKLLKLILILYQ